MTDILTVILPVFIVLAFGYGAVWRGLFSDDHVDGLMKFTQTFAIPCLLFRAISTLDLGQNFNGPLLLSFYTGATVAFGLGLLAARLLFRRNWQDSVAIAFCCLFSNSLLLGLPITERAFGPDALSGNYAIIAIHAPFCYLLGITAMELARAQGTALSHVPAKVGRAMFSNALVIGICTGLVVNLGQIPLPVVLTDAIDLMVRAALPAALFGLGGVLYRYRPEGDIRTILFVCAVSLLVHPTLTYTLGTAGDLGRDALRSAVVTASAAPGINAYVFANMYGAARRVAASAVLIGTALSILTTSLWITLLP
ncbi:AEC family transporter [Pseudooctadecabacter jejudonensis]|uniref:Membrane transport protein n=1 Tax=Pseudooctadecabacter jejudonensis TaxID=1391910 RepID=A0A1Y5SE53_9RHOB|nr:AEC family transporter [Pseudooctadecabacter jejudonensis]SLN38661.1 Membrane transport protein [Pseudooctadecabacter jejudonensis]